MSTYLENFQEFFGPLSNAQRAMFVGLMIVVLSLVGGLLYWAQQEDKVLLFGSLQTEVAQEIVTELNNRGIDYELQESGRAIYVGNDRVHELRLELAPMSGGYSDVKGYELFDANSLGMTDFMQQVNKKRALEGELARSINSLDQVEFSRIHLVLPERSPFQETSIEASASVILNLKQGQTLKKEQIAGITSLIAGSVEGLDSGNVTVLDQAGNRLTDEIDYDSELALGSTQMQLRQKTEAYLTERGQSMLDRVLGAGNSILRVSVEHDFDRLVRESDLIDPDSRTVISEEKREQTNNDEVMEPIAANRVNTNQEAASVVVSSNNNGSTTQTRNYEVNRTREVFEKTQGELKMVSASVLLNYKQLKTEGENGEQVIQSEPYTDEEVEEFREVVKVALGIQQERGDQLSIKQVEFFDSQAINGVEYFTGQPTFTNNILRWSLIGVTFIIIIVLMNSLKKKSGSEDLNFVNKFESDDQLKDGEKMKSIEGDNDADGADATSGNDKLAEGEEPKKLVTKNYNKDEIVNFVELKPAEAAQVMRAMITSDEN